MGLKNGFYFLKPAETFEKQWVDPENKTISFGYVMLRYCGNFCRVQCMIENLPALSDSSCQLILTSANGAVLPLFSISLYKMKNGTFGGMWEEKIPITGPKQTVWTQSNGLYLVMAHTKEPILHVFGENAAPPAEVQTPPASVIPPPVKPQQKTEPEPEPEQQPQKTPSPESLQKLQNIPKEKLAQFLSLEMQFFDPFATTNDAYSWWVCPEYLAAKQLLARLDLRLPSPLHKALYEGFIQHRHILFGIYTERQSDRHFIILGIPSTDETQNEGNAQLVARWTRYVTNYNQSDHLGYWLYYIDYEKSALVRAVLKT